MSSAAAEPKLADDKPAPQSTQEPSIDQPRNRRIVSVFGRFALFTGTLVFAWLLAIIGGQAVSKIGFSMPGGVFYMIVFGAILGLVFPVAWLGLLRLIPPFWAAAISTDFNIILWLTGIGTLVGWIVYVLIGLAGSLVPKPIVFVLLYAVFVILSIASVLGYVAIMFGFDLVVLNCLIGC